MIEFVEVPVMRGFTEIREIHRICEANNAYIAGGYVRYMASQREAVAAAGDVDIFAADKDDEKLLRAFRDLGYTVAFDSENAYSLNKPTSLPDGYSTLLHAPTPQIIKSGWIGSDLCDTLRQFDFTVVMAGLLSPETALVHSSFIEDDLAGNLVIEHITDPVRIVLRALKYARRGYRMMPNEILRILDSVRYQADDDQGYEDWSEYWEDADDDWDDAREW